MTVKPFIFIHVKALTATFILLMSLLSARHAEAVVGVNWGRLAYQRFVPSMVVDLLLQNKISEIKIYSFSQNVMEAFRNSGIDLTISIPNEGLHDIMSKDEARNWVKKYVTSYLNQGVDIRYVLTGSEPYTPIANKTFDIAFDALKLIQNALNEAGHGKKIKATIPHFIDVLKLNVKKPSQTRFRDDIKGRIVDSLQFLKENNAPAMMDLPFLNYVLELGLDRNFAFFDNKSKEFFVDDNGLNYTNAFELFYDSFVWAMANAAVPDVKLVIGGTGWPTDGISDANMADAERYYKGLLPFVMSNQGTPMRPGEPIDIYIHALADENKMSIRNGPFQRHWGIYMFNGEPKFKIDFSGKGRDIFPSVAKGVIEMPKRWCIFNGNMNNLMIVEQQFETACNNSDCTSLAPGGTCSHLEFKQNISYAFNQFFQTRSQAEDVWACDFEGLGQVVTSDPSDGKCIFPVAIIQAEIADKGASLGLGFNGRAMQPSLPRLTILLPLLYVLLLIWDFGYA